MNISTFLHLNICQLHQFCCCLSSFYQTLDNTYNVKLEEQLNLIINQIGCKNMRKISTKLITLDDKNKKTEPKTSDNQYYLPHPQIRLVKTPVKYAQLQQQKDKNIIKLVRKTSQHAPIRTFSIANFKSDVQNVSKEQDTTPQNKNNLGKKVELRKFRSTSDRQTPKRSLSKSGVKLQLNSAKKDLPNKRLNLKIQTPLTKKHEKGNLGSSNFDSYYNNQGVNVESKTVRVQRKLEANSSDSAHSQFSKLFGRCKKIIEQYQQKLENAKLENKALRQQNQKLKSLKDAVKKDPLEC